MISFSLLLICSLVILLVSSYWNSTSWIWFILAINLHRTCGNSLLRALAWCHKPSVYQRGKTILRCYNSDYAYLHYRLQFWTVYRSVCPRRELIQLVWPQRRFICAWWFLLMRPRDEHIIWFYRWVSPTTFLKPLVHFYQLLVQSLLLQYILVINPVWISSVQFYTLSEYSTDGL